MGDQKFWILVVLKVDSWFYSVTVSCSCVLILGIRNSEYFYNHKQMAVFVSCHKGGSEILNPCGIKNRLLFCSVKLWAGGSEILNLSQKESTMGARSEILNTLTTMNRWLSLAVMGDQKFWILVVLKVDSWLYPVTVSWSWGSEILNTFITMNR